MAESTPIEQRDPGAPIARGQIDPDLVKLPRPQPKIGMITAAGVVALCLVFLVRLGPDRRFAGHSAEPAVVTTGDILAGKVETDTLIGVAAEPLVGQAIRATKAPGIPGLRVVPMRGSGERLWVVVSGDGWDAPAPVGYVGRLRRLDDLVFAEATRQYASDHPRPVFAVAAAVRAGLATHTVTTVAGDSVTLADSDLVALDRVEAEAAVIVASFNDRLPDAAAWLAALHRAGVTPQTTDAPDPALGEVRFHVAQPVAATTAQLEAAGLWAARIEPVTHHYDTTWGALRKSPPTGLDLGAGAPVPDAQLDLIGLYVARGIPADAYAVVTGEIPDDYWYVLPITVALAAILLIFAWALVRAVRRDLVPARAA